ncbi:MAG: cyclase family protein [Halanaerobiales bacterium]
MLSFPGDTIPELNRIKNIENDNYNLSNIKVSVHLGTRVDAPSHFIENGKTIEEVPAERFIGDVQVIEIKDSQLLHPNQKQG